MKNIIIALLILISIAIIYNHFFPVHFKKDEAKPFLIKGDTSITINQIEVKDSNSYSFVAKIDSNRAPDSSTIIYSTDFFIGDSILGTTGHITFDTLTNLFSFDSIIFFYPEIIKTSTDTLKYFSTHTTPFYFNEWFYSTIALILILLFAL